MRSAGGRRSLANPDALEEEDEVMPLAASDRKSRRYVRVRHRLGQRYAISHLSHSSETKK